MSLPCAIATVPSSPSPLDLLRTITREVTGIAPARSSTRYDMQNDLLALLPEWGGLLIVDELQNVKVDAMRDLTWLYEESGHGFSLLLVGSTVLDAVRQHPQLATRIMCATRFEALRLSLIHI